MLNNHRFIDHFKFNLSQYKNSNYDEANTRVDFIDKFFETGNTSGIQPSHKQKLRMRLTALDTATEIHDIDLPGFRLHQLKGNRQNLWAIDVSKNWRITFKFHDRDVFIVNYEDYH